MGISRFNRRDGSTFKCDVCGRGTRHTGVQSLGSKLCPQCFELAGIENDISDGHNTAAGHAALITQYTTEIREKGGDLSEWQALLDAVAKAAAPTAVAILAAAQLSLF